MYRSEDDILPLLYARLDDLLALDPEPGTQATPDSERECTAAGTAQILTSDRRKGDRRALVIAAPNAQVRVAVPAHCGGPTPGSGTA